MKKKDPNLQTPSEIATVSYYLDRIKEEQIKKFGKSGKNVKCPCDSGKSLKKCCGKTYNPFTFFDDTFNSQ